MIMAPTSARSSTETPSQKGSLSSLKVNPHLPPNDRDCHHWPGRAAPSHGGVDHEFYRFVDFAYGTAVTTSVPSDERSRKCLASRALQE